MLCSNETFTECDGRKLIYGRPLSCENAASGRSLNKPHGLALREYTDSHHQTIGHRTFAEH
jgi:hypothetical protein